VFTGTRRENPRLAAVAPLSCHFVTEAPAFSVVADFAIERHSLAAGHWRAVYRRFAPIRDPAGRWQLP
jgi:hypothetical protein